MRYLDEKSLGFKAFGSINVPIVPAASLFDLNVDASGRVRLHYATLNHLGTPA